jgi:hypothetical protein
MWKELQEIMQHRRKSYRPPEAERNKPVEQLLHIVEHRISGDKVLTLVYDTPPQEVVVDVSATGQWGYAVGVRELFTAKLISAMNSGGGLLVRAFLPMFFEHRPPNGKPIQIPYKKLYGFALGQKRWSGITAEDLKDSCCTDAVTGQPIPSEPGVFYADTWNWETTPPPSP